MNITFVTSRKGELFLMDQINNNFTQEQEGEQPEGEQPASPAPEAEVMSDAAVAAPLLSIVPVEAHVTSVWLPQQMVTRAQLQHLMDTTDWAPEQQQVYFVDLEGSFTLSDLLHVLHTTNWAEDLDDNWVDDGRFDEGGVGTLSIPVHRGSGSGVTGVGKKGEKGSKKRPRKVRLRAVFILQSIIITSSHSLSLTLSSSLTRAQVCR
jgi:hypothetical protein